MRVLTNMIASNKKRTVIAAALLAAMSISCTMHSGDTQSPIDRPTRFDNADSDDDGFLGWPEIDNAYSQVLDQVEWSAIDLFAWFDRDGDEHLDPQEHERFMQQIKEQLREYAPDSAAELAQDYPAFDVLDRDNNQLLTDAELAQTPLAKGDRHRLFDDNGDGMLGREEYEEYVTSQIVAEQY